jgi:hypothetical protein
LDEQTIITDNGKNVLFVPLDSKIPKIRIFTRQIKELMTKRISVAIGK